MEIEFDMPEGEIPVVATSCDEFIVDHPNDKEIYESMPMARMAARRLLRQRKDIAYLEIMHRVKSSDGSVETLDVEMVEQIITIDL